MKHCTPVLSLDTGVHIMLMKELIIRFSPSVMLRQHLQLQGAALTVATQLQVAMPHGPLSAQGLFEGSRAGNVSSSQF